MQQKEETEKRWNSEMTDVLETQEDAFEAIAEDRIDREKGIIR